MYRKVLVCVFTACVLVTGCHAGDMYLCGATLANSLAFVCRGRGYYWTHSKRSAGAHISRRDLADHSRGRRNVHSPFLDDSEATDFLTKHDGGKVRVRRGIVDECCLSPCNFQHLESYCAQKTTLRSPTTTTTRPRPPKTTTPPTAPPPTTTPPKSDDTGNDVSDENTLYEDNNLIDTNSLEQLNSNGSTVSGETIFQNNNETVENTSTTTPGNPTNELIQSTYRMTRPTRPGTTVFNKVAPKIKFTKYLQKKLRKMKNTRNKGKKKYRFSTKLFTTSIPRLSKSRASPDLHKLLKRYYKHIGLHK